MEKLFSTSLLNSPVTINKTQCHVITQVTTLAGINRYISYILAKDTTSDKYYVLQVDKNNKIVPAHPKHLETICKTLPKVHFSKEPNLDLNMKYRKIAGLKHITPCKVSSNIVVVLGPGPELQQYLRIEINLGNLSNRLSAFKDFIFYAFDGSNTHLHISFSIEDFFNCKHWHFSSGFKVIIDDHVESEYFPVDVKVAEGIATMLCQTDLFHALNSSRMGKTQLCNLTVYESLDFLVSCAGFTNAVVFPEGYTPSKTWYTVAIPISGISVTEEVGIGITQYYPKGHSEISRLIATDSLWEQFDTIAFLQINANSMYEAYAKGKKQIQQSLDFAINLLKDDCIYTFHSISNHAVNRSVEHHHITARTLPFAFIEAPLHDKRISIEFVPQIQEPIAVTKEFASLLADNQKIEMLMIKAEGKPDEAISPLLNALKWVRKAWDSDDIEDQIIFAVTALEFIVSTEKGGTPLMERSFRKKVLPSLSDAIRTQYTGENVDEYVKRIEDKFHQMCTEIPFMQKLRNLIERLSIPVSPTEFDMLHQLRKHRNKIIHGESLEEITVSKLKLICQIISTIAFYKLNSITLI